MGRGRSASRPRTRTRRGAAVKTYRVDLRTRNQHVTPRDVDAVSTGDALRTLLGTADWPEPSVIVLTVGDVSLDRLCDDLRDIAELARLDALHSPAATGEERSDA